MKYYRLSCVWHFANDDQGSERVHSGWSMAIYVLSGFLYRFCGFSDHLVHFLFHKRPLLSSDIARLALALRRPEGAQVPTREARAT